jgi:uncharacterized membrane protein
MARTDLAPMPVAIYAGVFVLVNAAYLLFEREIFAQAEAGAMPEPARRLARRRTLIGLAIFALAGLVAPFVPLLGFFLICCALVLYLQPEIFSSRLQGQAE